MNTELISFKPALDEIAILHGEITAAARTSLEKAMRVGELLAGIKAGLSHGKWLPWVAANLPFTDRTARNYLRVFEKRDKIKSESVSDLTTAYRLLGDTSAAIGEIDIYDRPAFYEAYIQLMARVPEWDKALESNDPQTIIGLMREAQALERVWRCAALECERELGRCLIKIEQLRGKAA